MLLRVPRLLALEIEDMHGVTSAQRAYTISAVPP